MISPPPENNPLPKGQEVWNEAQWNRLEQDTRRRAVSLSDPDDWRLIVRASRKIMRLYTTSFFIVSRFLPRPKRDQVEIIYASVRYPDEVVDTFPLSPSEKLQRLDTWSNAYETALHCNTLGDALRANVPCFLAAFAEVVRHNRIPPEHYRDFLAAMRRDVVPRPFDTLDDLINSYIHGSAIVVGYFLAHVYGAATPDDFPRALQSARDLGIGLQLTNFLRDVGEDQNRERMYLPMDLLHAEGLEHADARDPAHRDAYLRVVKKLATVAADHYTRAADQLDAFAPDSRIAIQACMNVYGRLNQRILENKHGIAVRERVSFREKWAALPPSKYWKIPIAYLAP